MNEEARAHWGPSRQGGWNLGNRFVGWSANWFKFSLITYGLKLQTYEFFLLLENVGTSTHIILNRPHLLLGLDHDRTHHLVSLNSYIPIAISYGTPVSPSIYSYFTFQDSTSRKSKLVYQTLVIGGCGMHFRLPAAIGFVYFAIEIEVE